jgi:chromosome partitioning protein
MIVIAIVNLKGGSTKTTSAVFLAHVLAESDQRILLVDSDPQGSALRWHERAAFDFPVIKLDSGKLHRDLDGITGDRYDTVIIDTPPLETQRAIVLSALRRATHVLVPCAPTPIEYDRLTAVRDALEDASELRPDGMKPPTAILLTRTVAGAASTASWRESMATDGWTVLNTHVARLELYSQAYGGPITCASRTAYGDAALQLLALEVAA